jgi:hypothetical protein
MTSNQFIASHQLYEISKCHGASVNQLTNRLLLQLSSYSMPVRNSVELREAKTVLRQLRYPEESVALRVDEVLWALSTVKKACHEYGCADHSGIFTKMASILGIALDGQVIPVDLQRKINNEMRMFRDAGAAMPMAQAS